MPFVSLVYSLLLSDPMMLVQSAKMVRFEDTVAVLTKAVSDGEFGCCEMGHEIRQRDGSVIKIPCDKPRLGPVIQQMIAGALDRHLKEEQILLYRHLLMISHMMLSGLGTEEPPWNSSSMAAFLHKYGFSSPTDNTKCPTDTKTRGGIVGHTPLFYAAAAGALQVVRELLAQPGVLQKINLQPKVGTIGSTAENLYGDMPMYGTPILVAAFINGDPAMLELLVRHGADLTRVITGGANYGGGVLWLLAGAGHMKGMEWLHQHLANEAWIAQMNNTNNFGCTALSLTLLFQNPPAAKFLIAHGHDLGNATFEPSGVSNLTYASREGM
jgi:hypothetical protein